MGKHVFRATLLVLLFGCGAAFAQQTTGNITGRALDQQGAAIPGVTVTAKSTATGFTRTGVTDSEGVYRLTALPVGTYAVKAVLQGFTTVTLPDIVVRVAETASVDLGMKVAQRSENVTVTGTPMFERTSSSVGSVVDTK